MNIRVLREAGGIGDVVRVIPAIRGLRETYPRAHIDAFLPHHYAPLVERAGVAHRVIKTNMHQRRSRLAVPDESKHPYLKTDRAYDLTVDLYCPAFAHELKHRHDVWNDRIELFCEAAGCYPENMTPHISLKQSERDHAREILRGSGVPERKGWVALQPFSTDPARNWPKADWAELAELMGLAGYGVFAIDGNAGRCHGLPCPLMGGKSLIEAAAILSVCRLVIGPDSGLLHLAGAVNTPGLGVVCSQSGGVLYRHYPKHTYIQPELKDTPPFCKWPCLWNRPARCTRSNLSKAGDTCNLLKTIPPALVAETALRLLDSAAGRLPGVPPPGPSASPRAVLSLLPPRAHVLDVWAGLSEELTQHQCRHSITFHAAHVIPVPVQERAYKHAAFFAVDGKLSATQWLRELSRVLDVGGKLYAPIPDTLARAHGFKRIAEGIYEKETTWPKFW